jgi:hypothetical protein
MSFYSHLIVESFSYNKVFLNDFLKAKILCYDGLTSAFLAITLDMPQQRTDNLASGKSMLKIAKCIDQNIP